MTDICSTNPKDPTYCATPADIKIDRIKADLLYSSITDRTAAENASLATGTEYPEKVWWFFSKCWDDGLAQPVYNSTKNWFTNPPLPNNLKWSQAALTQQYNNNAASYPAEGLPAYKDGAYKTGAERQADIFDYSVDWKVGDPDPIWCPVAGGKGYGQPTGDCHS